MAREDDRYVRLPAGGAGGAKIASRRDVNPGLSHAEAMDDRPFLALLRPRLGEPDRHGDARFSYSIRDKKLGFDFEVYSGASGPAYGGSPRHHYVDFEGDDNRTKPEVLAALAEFEQWLARG